MQQAWSGEKQAVFRESFAGQQPNLKQDSKFYWSPMEGMKQWTTASKGK